MKRMLELKKQEREKIQQSKLEEKERKRENY